MRVNLELLDGTVLHDVYLSTSNKDCRIGMLKSDADFYNWYDDINSKTIYFYGNYVQGGISSPQIVEKYELIEDDNTKFSLICSCGRRYDYIPKNCYTCGQEFK